MGNAYIYGLADPRTGVIRYVGKSVDPRGRLGTHLGRGSKSETHCARWIRALRRVGLQPDLGILEGPCEDWEEAERRWIAALRPQLTNLTSGGDGPYDLVRTPEHRAAIGRANKRRKYTDEMRENSSRAQKARFAKLTPEEQAELRAVRSAAAKKRGKWSKPMSAEGRANVAAGKLGVKGTPEARANMRAAHQARKGSLGWQEQQDQNSLRMQRLWKDPEYRARHIAALKAVELAMASCVLCRREITARVMWAHHKACKRS